MITLPNNFFSEKLEKIELHEVINKAIEKSADIISDQVTSQLQRGVDGKDESLGEYASYAYKGRLEPVDLRLTGDFWRSIVPKTYNDYFEMTATDPKTEMLTQKYGDAILDLDSQSVATAAEYIKEEMITIFSNEINA